MIRIVIKVFDQTGLTDVLNVIEDCLPLLGRLKQNNVQIEINYEEE